MNGTSFLLLLVFLVAGYVIHPLALPKLQNSGYGIVSTDEADPKKNPADDADATAKNLEPKDVNPRITDELAEPRDMTTNNGATAEPMPKVDSEPEPTPTPEVKVEPTPTPTPAPAANFTDAQAIAAMQSSIKSGSITEFQFSQVKEWKFKGEETINGEAYQVGVASYTAKTLFGEQNHDAKALFKDGKLVKWVWAVNNFEMK